MNVFISNAFFNFNRFHKAREIVIKKDFPNIKNEIIPYVENIKSNDDTYNLHWYVIGEAKKFKSNKLYKIKIWNNDYLVWKNNGTYVAMDDDCSHRGASLSNGVLVNNNVMCPYHGYEFNSNGVLCKVPGLNFTNNNCQNQQVYKILEKEGWIYMNNVGSNYYLSNNSEIFQEPESKNENFRSIFINKIFKAYGRIVSENSLDVMHIGFVHTFGNRERPSPIKENPPHLVNDYPFHYRTQYTYASGKDSIAKKLFNVKELVIENEFILPHTTIARVKFADLVSTVITSTLPMNLTHSQLFVKTYRNFWNSQDNSPLGNLVNYLGDIITTNMMDQTVMQDKSIVENIKYDKMDGKFNMKFDKLQNTYKTFYKRLIHDNKKE
jgi:phenylpropionate dioxygenase-like ring-hydroxylating dioxygenase large terminal subunit